MIVVSDASPLIFLAKLDRLNILPELFKDKITILSCVVDEILSERASLVEKERLKTFVEKNAIVIPFTESDIVSQSLSASDQHSLTYCERHQADWLIADERLLRRVAGSKGIATIGFIRLLIKAIAANLLTSEQVKNDLEQAISNHGLRISLPLYQRLLQELRLIP